MLILLLKLILMFIHLSCGLVAAQPWASSPVCDFDDACVGWCEKVEAFRELGFRVSGLGFRVQGFRELGKVWGLIKIKSSSIHRDY